MRTTGQSDLAETTRQRKLPVKLRAVWRELPVKFRAALRRVPAKMPRRKKTTKTPAKPLDTLPQKGGRGRPSKIPLSWVIGRAGNHRTRLTELWPKLETALLTCRTEQNIANAFENHGQPYTSHYVPELVADILALIRDPKFPKRQEQRINFLADSVGGRPDLALRTSRDICEKERARQRRKSPHKILRHEYYVECSCGYRGPACDNACRKCGAEIALSLDELMGRGLF